MPNESDDRNSKATIVNVEKERAEESAWARSATRCVRGSARVSCLAMAQLYIDAEPKKEGPARLTRKIA